MYCLNETLFRPFPKEIHHNRFSQHTLDCLPAVTMTTEPKHLNSGYPCWSQSPYGKCATSYQRSDLPVEEGKMSKNEGEDKARDDFLRKKHIQFFKRCLNVLPSSYSSLDTTRYFSIKFLFIMY